jgi:hypothetical protein
VAAVREATSQKAREVAHPQLFRSTFRDRPALYFPRDVAHPPSRHLRAIVFQWTVGYLSREEVQDETRNCGADFGVRCFCISAKAQRKDTQPPRQRNGLYIRRAGHFNSQSNLNVNCNGGDNNVNCNGSSTTSGSSMPAQQVPFHVRVRHLPCCCPMAARPLSIAKANLRNAWRGLAEIVGVAAYHS